MSALGKIEQLLQGVHDEERRSADTLHLTAYENRMSRLAQSFLASNLSFRQHEGTLDEHGIEDVVLHGSFMLMGLPGVYTLERAAREAAQRMFHAAVSDFRPTSGLHGMLCTLAAATEPGDAVYSINPMDGGHFATRHVLTRLGRRSLFIPWSSSEMTIDLGAFADAVKKQPPKAVFFEYGTPLFRLPVEQVRKIVGEEPLLVYDASHTIGLIAGGVFQDPLREGCNILQGNMHKTFSGPQKGMLHFRDREEGLRIAASISAGLVSNQSAHHAIAAYITTLEMQEFGREYALQMLENAQTLAHALAGAGFRLISCKGEYTRSHQVILCGKNLDEHCRRLFACGISTNARNAYGQHVIRLGVQEVTRRGMKIADMEYIAALFKRIILDKEPVEAVRQDVIAFNRRFSTIAFSFDEALGLNAR